MLGRGTDKIWPLVDEVGLLWILLLLGRAGAPPKKKHWEEMPGWGHGGTDSTGKPGVPRASAYAGLQPMDLVPQLSFVALSRGKVMLKHPVNSGQCLGGFSESSLMQCLQFTLDFTLWSSWRLRSSCFLHLTGIPGPSSSSLEQHLNPYKTKTLQECLVGVFLHDYFDSSSQLHSKPFWDEHKIILFIELCSTSCTPCLDPNLA